MASRTLYTTDIPIGGAAHFQSHSSGVFATQQLDPGTLIIDEEPLATFQIPNKDVWVPIEEALTWARGLSTADRVAMHELAWHVYGAFQSDQMAMAFKRIVEDGDWESLNKIRIALSERAYPYESKRQEGWVFCCDTVIRINHSCRPNAEAYFDRAKERLCIRAMRMIEENEETTLSYINENCTRQERRSRLVYHCACEKRSLTGEEFVRSENDRAELGVYYDTMYRLRNTHNMDRGGIFVMTDAAAHAISIDSDTKALLAMEKKLAKRRTPSSVCLALAYDTIAIITLTGSKKDRWIFVEAALRFASDALHFDISN